MLFDDASSNISSKFQQMSVGDSSASRVMKNPQLLDSTENRANVCGFLKTADACLGDWLKVAIFADLIRSRKASKFR